MTTPATSPNTKAREGLHKSESAEDNDANMNKRAANGTATTGNAKMKVGTVKKTTGNNVKKAETYAPNRRVMNFIRFSAVKEDRPLPGDPLADPGVRNYRTGLLARTRDGYGEGLG